MEPFENRIDLNAVAGSISKIRQEMKKVIIGQEKLIDLLITALLADGHVLIEGVPGIAKTLSVKLLSKTIGTAFSRIQFTPDLMPSDVLGTTVFNMNKSSFEFNRGPIFSNMILIDEINRAPAKTQSALFEVMEERQVTIDGKTYTMEKPFIVFATQNPVEHEGTYRLPEAQLDRFLFKIEISYPEPEEEIEILFRHHNRNGKAELDEIETVVSAQEIKSIQQIVRTIRIEENLRRYISLIVNKTRNNNSLYLGASPRASINIMNSAKVVAVMQGRDFVTPDDIRFVVHPVLVHRIQLTPEKEIEGIAPAQVIRQIVESIEIPR